MKHCLSDDSLAFYDQWAPFYDEDVRAKPWHRFDEACLRTLQEAGIRRLVDVGAGTGRLLSALYALGTRNFLLVEQSAEMLRFYIEKLRRLPDVSFRCWQTITDMNSDIESTLPVDLSLFAYSLTHFPDLGSFADLALRSRFVAMLMRNPDIHVLRAATEQRHFVRSPHSQKVLRDHYHSIQAIVDFFHGLSFEVRQYREFLSELKLYSGPSTIHIPRFPTNIFLCFEKVTHGADAMQEESQYSPVLHSF